MAVTQVGGPRNSQSFGSSITPDKPQTPTPGNLLLLCTYNFSGTPAGWTLVGQNTSVNGSLKAYCRIADGSAADNASFSSSSPAYCILEEYTGVNPANPVNAFSGDSNNNIVTFTPTVADAFIWAGAREGSGISFGQGGFWAAPMNQSGRYNPNDGFGGYHFITTANNQASGSGARTVRYFPVASTAPLVALALTPAPTGPEYFTQAGKVVPTTQAGPVQLVSH